MPGLAPGIHVLREAGKAVDGRDKPGHDELETLVRKRTEDLCNSLVGDGERDMIISGDRRISYPEIFARAAKAATGFRALGLSGGTPVAMMLRNDFAFFECSSAAATLGSP